MKDKINISDKEQRELFNVPVDYFEGLPQQIQARVQQRKKSVFRPVKWSVVLASLVLAVFFYLPKEQTKDAELITISSQEAYEYLLQNNIFLDEEYLTDALVDNDVAINAGAFYPNTTTEYINTDILNNISINYLDLEDYELED